MNNVKFNKFFQLLVVILILPNSLLLGQVDNAYRKHFGQKTMSEFFEFLIIFEREINQSNNVKLADCFYDTILIKKNPIFFLKEKYNEDTINTEIKLFNAQIVGLKDHKNFNIIQLKITSIIFSKKQSELEEGDAYFDDVSEDKKMVKTPIDTLKCLISVLQSKFVLNSQEKSTFKIIAIENFDETIYPKNYYKPFVPAFIDFRIAPGNSNLSYSENSSGNVYSDRDYNISWNLLMNYRLLKSSHFDVYAAIGIGMGNYSSKLGIDSYFGLYEAFDIENMEYNRFVELNDIDQKMTLNYLNIPVEFSLEKRLLKKISIFFGVGLNYSLLTNSSFEQISGSGQYYGKYFIDGFEVTLTELPEFGFSNYPARINYNYDDFINENLWSVYGRAGCSYSLSKNFDFCFAASYLNSSTKIHNLGTTALPINSEFGNIDPIVKYIQDPNLQNICLEFGIKFKLKNSLLPLSYGRIIRENKISKSVKNDFYKQDLDLKYAKYASQSENSDTTQTIIANIEYKERCSDETKTNSIKIPVYKHAVFKDENNLILNKTKSKIKQTFSFVKDPPDSTIYDEKGLYLMKPFGYDITNEKENVNNNMDYYYLPLKNPTDYQDIIVTKLPRFNFFIVDASINDPKDVQGEAVFNTIEINNQRPEMVMKLEELLMENENRKEECYVYMRSMDFSKFPSMKTCFDCKYSSFKTDIDKYVNSKYPSTSTDWIDDFIAHEHKIQLNPERRNFVIFLLFADIQRLDEFVNSELEMFLEKLNGSPSLYDITLQIYLSKIVNVNGTKKNTFKHEITKEIQDYLDSNLRSIKLGNIYIEYL